SLMTLTVSVAAPSSRRTLTVAGTPALITTCWATPALKLVLVTMTLYWPAATEERTHASRSSVMDLKLWSVARLVTVTRALGMVAAVGSVTMSSRLVVVPWDQASEAARIAAAHVAYKRDSFFIVVPPIANAGRRWNAPGLRSLVAEPLTSTAEPREN